MEKTEARTDNVPDTTEATDNVPATRKKRYWGEGDYQNVTLHLDPIAWKAIKTMAAREETTITNLVNEALMAWVKWLAKAEREEAVGEDKEADKERVDQEFKEAADLLYTIRQARRMKSAGVQMLVKKREKMEKALASRKAWHRIYPGKPWPGAKGIVPEGFKPWVKKKKADNVPETGNVENSTTA